MKQTCLLLCQLALTWAAPQTYSEQAAPLSDDTYATIQEVFGSSEKQVDASGYSNTADLTDSNVDVLVQVIKEADSQYPSDYVQPDSSNLVKDKATVEVDNVFENCADYTEQFGYMCVPYYQCSNGTIITDGAGLIDIRNGFGSLTPEDSKCPGFLDVCCKDPEFVPPPPPPIVKYQPQCGQRNQNGLGARIQGFTEAESQFGEWPHMCAVLHEKPVEQEAGYSGEPETVNLYQCGGSLIAPGVLLTAAHCVDKFRQQPGELKIRCGEWDTQHQTEPYPHQDRYVETLAIHPEFDGRNLQNDFAVLFTSENFLLDQHIDTACLPDAGEVFDGTSCFATGWGKDEFGAAGQYQVVLKEIELPVVNRDACEAKLRTTRLGQKFKLDDSFLCAGGVAGRDTCKGDGGSPLVCPSKQDPDTYVQAGIVAWGIGCGEDATPGVYADVSTAVCWIDAAVTCHYGAQTGDFSPYFGHGQEECGVWLERKVAELERKEAGAGNYGQIFAAIRSQYTQCAVSWPQLQPSAPLISDLERDTADQTDGGYADTSAGVVDTSAAQTDAGYTDTSADVTDGSYVDTVDTSDQQTQDSSADQTSEKQVEPSYAEAEAGVEGNERL